MDKFIQRSIDAGKIIFHDQELFYVLNLNYQLEYCSEDYAHFLGYTTTTDLFDMIVDDNDLLNYFGISKNHSLQVSNQASPHVLLVFVSDKFGKKLPLFSVVRRILDDEHKLVGFFINNIRAFFNADKLQLLEKLNPNFMQKRYVSSQCLIVKLSKREEEVLFLLLHGKSAREITDFINRAEQSNISVNTIKSIINKQLYLKFDVYDLATLLNKSRQQGYTNFIPTSFIINQGIHLCDH